MKGKIICNCNGVSLAEIKVAIKKKGARCQEDIERITGASSSCGRCRNKVIQILEENSLL